MRQYRTRQVRIEAQQFLGGIANAEPIMKWVNENRGKAVWCGAMPPRENSDGRIKHPGLPESLRIRTQDGWMMVFEGDFVIRTEKGQFYPCKRDDFEEMYEDVPGQGADVVRLPVPDWNNTRIRPVAN